MLKHLLVIIVVSQVFFYTIVIADTRDEGCTQFCLNASFTQQKSYLSYKMEIACHEGCMLARHEEKKALNNRTAIQACESLAKKRDNEKYSNQILRICKAAVNQYKQSR